MARDGGDDALRIVDVDRRPSTTLQQQSCRPTLTFLEIASPCRGLRTFQRPHGSPHRPCLDRRRRSRTSSRRRTAPSTTTAGPSTELDVDRARSCPRTPIGDAPVRVRHPRDSQVCESDGGLNRFGVETATPAVAGGGGRRTAAVVVGGGGSYPNTSIPSSRDKSGAWRDRHRCPSPPSPVLYEVTHPGGPSTCNLGIGAVDGSYRTRGRMGRCRRSRAAAGGGGCGGREEDAGLLARTVSIDASFDPDDPGRFSPEQHEGGNGGIIDGARE